MRSSLTPLGNGIVIGLILIITGIVYVTLSLIPNDNQTTLIEQIQNPIEIIKPKPKSITLGFVGDIIPHIPITNSVKSEGENAFDYTSLFYEISNILSRPDILIGNLETPVSNTDSPSGYPRFNAPLELLTALEKVGFDALQTTNNHSLDQGVSGLEDTLRNVSDAGILPIGGTLYPTMAYEPVIHVQNDISIGFIATSFGFNGFTLPTEKKHLANVIDDALLETAIMKAKNQGADVIIIMPHFGSEYQQLPNESQKSLSQNLITLGASAIVGTHPHVIQPITEIETSSGDKALIAYSLGNFVSNQRDLYTDLELYLELTYVKDPKTGAVSLQSYSTIPMYMRRTKDDNGKNIFKIYPLDKALDLPDLSETEMSRLLKYQQEFPSILSPSTVLN